MSADRRLENRSLVIEKSWGEDICLLAGCDANYLPGFIGLANSARANGFAGRILLLVNDSFDRSLLPKTDVFDVLAHPANRDIFTPAEKFSVLPGLPNGKYLLLDTDILIERPCGALLEPIRDGLLVSTEHAPKYDAYESFVYQQCKALGWESVPPAYPYLNCGLVGFQLPRDKALLEQYAILTSTHLKGVGKVFSHPWFLFPEQDIFNLLVRRSIAEGRQVFSISPRFLELGFPGREMFDRKFPYAAESRVFPKDQTKYFIHGAALRRPWLVAAATGWKGRIERWGILPFRRKWKRMLTPYERAWAYFTCSAGMAIPLESWSGAFGFAAHRHWLWRRAYSLPS